MPVNHLFTESYIAEAGQDQLLPEGEGVLTFADLDIVPRPVTVWWSYPLYYCD